MNKKLLIALLWTNVSLFGLTASFNRGVRPPSLNREQGVRIERVSVVHFLARQRLNRSNQNSTQPNQNVTFLDRATDEYLLSDEVSQVVRDTSERRINE